MPRTHVNEYNTFVYNYIEQVENKKYCVEIIPQKCISHLKKHRCNKEPIEHICNARCPDCAVYCTLPFDH